MEGSCWNLNTMTCPQCRKKSTEQNIAPRLVWIERRHLKGLRKELGIRRENLLEKEKENCYLTGQVNGFKAQVADACVNYRYMEMLHCEDVETISSLRSELSFHKQLQSEAETSKRQVEMLNRKLNNLRMSKDSIKVRCQEAVAKSQQLKERVEELSKELDSYRCELNKTKLELAKFYKDYCSRSPDAEAFSGSDHHGSRSSTHCLYNKRIKLEPGLPENPTRDLLDIKYMEVKKQEVKQEFKPNLAQW